MSITEWLLDLGVHLIDKVGYLGMFAALVLDSCGLPIPSEAVLALSGAAARTGRFNFLLVVILASIAQTLGAYLAYLIGRYGGEPLIERFGKYVFVSTHDLEKAHLWIRGRGKYAIFVSRLIPVIRTYSGFVAGIIKMKPKRFLEQSFLGSALWSLLFASLGWAVGDSWHRYANLLHYVDYIVLVIVVVVIFRYIYRKAKRRS